MSIISHQNQKDFNSTWTFIKRSFEDHSLKDHLMLSNLDKTTSEHWRRTPGTQKGSPLFSKGGRAKYKRQKETKQLGIETCAGES